MKGRAKETGERKDWQEEQQRFTRSLPKVRESITWAFRELPSWVDREEAIQEGLALAWSAWRSAVRQGKDPATFAKAIGKFSARHALEGRRIAGSSGTNIFGGDSCLSSRRCALPLGRGHGGELCRQAVTYLADNLLTPVPDQAAFRIDFRTWEAKLNHRQKAIAALSLEGRTTEEIARQLGTTAYIIQRARQRLWRSWQRFQGDLTD